MSSLAQWLCFISLFCGCFASASFKLIVAQSFFLYITFKSLNYASVHIRTHCRWQPWYLHAAHSVLRGQNLKNVHKSQSPHHPVFNDWRIYIKLKSTRAAGRPPASWRDEAKQTDSAPSEPSNPTTHSQGSRVALRVTPNGWWKVNPQLAAKVKYAKQTF